MPGARRLPASTSTSGPAGAGRSMPSSSPIESDQASSLGAATGAGCTRVYAAFGTWRETFTSTGSAGRASTKVFSTARLRSACEARGLSASTVLIFVGSRGERDVPYVGDQHVARGVRDAERQLRVEDDRLRRDPAGPENGNLVVA